jgi:aldose 1-epimerase
VSALISRHILQLASADGLWRAQISPVGASLVSLWHGDIEVVTSPYNEPLRALAGSVMAPWPNRLEDGAWQLGDREFTATINDADGHNANHGLAFDKEFALASQTDSRLRLELNLFDEQAYPFSVLLSVTYLLQNTGLQVELEAKNLSNQDVPVAFGMHPYFVLDRDSTLSVDAKTWITKNARNLPVSASTFENSPLANNAGQDICNLELDECFTDLRFDSNDVCVTTVTRPSLGIAVEVEQSRELSHLMLYRLQESSQPNRSLLAIEPQSSPANAFRNLESVASLAPAATFKANYRVKFRSL